MLRLATLIIGFGTLIFSVFYAYVMDDRGYADTMDFLWVAVMGFFGLLVGRYALRSHPVSEEDDLLSIWIDYKKAELRKRRKEIDP